MYIRLKELLVLFFLRLLLSNANGQQFLHDDLQCLDDAVEYQCIVDGSGMQWIVQNASGIGIDGSPKNYVSFGDIGGIEPIGEVFTIEQLSQSPSIITNISFTVKFSINGYTIICVDGTTSSSSNFTVTIPGPPSIPPSNTRIDTFTNSSVNISWTESSSPCVTGYRYNISSSALEENIIMESTSNSVMVEGLVPSDDQYNVTVAAIDTANRASNGSDITCFLFNVPQSFEIVDFYNETGSNKNTVQLVVTWKAPNNSCGCEFFPMLTGFVVSVTTSVSNNLPGPVTLSPSASTYTFENIPEGGNYTITVIAKNDVGNTSTDMIYEAPGTLIPITTTSSSSSSVAPSSTIMIGSTPARSPSISSITYSSSSIVSLSISPTVKGAVLETPAIVGIVAGGIILILVITVVVLVIVFCVCCKRDHGSASHPIPLKEKHPSTRAQPETGQPTYEDPGVRVHHKQAPTGDLYAEPDVKSSGRRPPPQPQDLPTYQDPNTIQRQQAPTGDVYAMPDKKPQVKKPGPVEVYADLDMSSASPRSPQPLLPSESQQPVLYSDVKYP